MIYRRSSSVIFAGSGLSSKKQASKSSCRVGSIVAHPAIQFNLFTMKIQPNLREYISSFTLIAQNERSDILQLFDVVEQEFFKPLTGVNRRKYVDIITLLWANCKRSPVYGESKSIILDWLEDYFYGLNEDISLEADETDSAEELAPTARTPRFFATAFLRRLKDTGWLEERAGGYEEEPQIVINHKIVPIIRSFSDVVSPQMVAYKGKLFKVYKLLQSIGESESPYESVLREVSGDLDDLNAALRQLAASIGTYIDDLTRGKTPEEILELFDDYEQTVVVGAYHRFKTNDNLFYYKSELYEQLELCRTKYLEALIRDYSLVEQVSDEEANVFIGRLVHKLEEDLREMSDIMKVIDERHILYRTRAVQRAQFLLLSDGTVKSRINRILRCLALSVQDPDDLNDICDETIASIFQMFPQGYFDFSSLKQPTPPRRPTPIQELPTLDDPDGDAVALRQQLLLQYIRNAVTAENVNRFASSVLKGRQAVTAQALVSQHPKTEDLVKIIGLHTYSQSTERVYEITLKPNIIECNSLRFQDFTVKERG